MSKSCREASTKRSGQAMLSLTGTLPIPSLECRGMILDQLDKLARRALEAHRRARGVEPARVDHVQGFGEHGGVVTVLRAAGDAPAGAPRPPQRRPRIPDGHRLADLLRQGQAEPEERHPFILLGAPALTRV